jgi:hypothetical protein
VNTANKLNDIMVALTMTSTMVVGGNSALNEAPILNPLTIGHVPTNGGDVKDFAFVRVTLHINVDLPPPHEDALSD